MPFLADNLADDFLIISIAYVPLSQDPAVAFFALLFLHFSLWAIYEVGYFENDFFAKKHEPKGKVPELFEEYHRDFSEFVSWLAATALGSAGIALLAWSNQLPDWISSFAGNTILGAALVWAGVLVALRFTYACFNRVDKMTRTFIYLPLQGIKYGFAAVFLYLPAAGVALVFSQIMRRWIPYLIYRHAGKDTKDIEPRVMRLIVFLALWLLLLPANHSFEHLIIGSIGCLVLLLRSQARLRALYRRMSMSRNDNWGEQQP